MSYKENFIKFMVQSGVLTFGDFVTKSGRNTPYFINTGNYRTGAQAQKLGQYYASCIAANMGENGISEETNVLFGPAYKGIPLAVSTSIALYAEYRREFNYCFNRKEKKDHGEGGNMVGHKLQAGDRVLITEDVITAGTAIRETLPLLLGGAFLMGAVGSILGSRVFHHKTQKKKFQIGLPAALLFNIAVTVAVRYFLF